MMRLAALPPHSSTLIVIRGSGAHRPAVAAVLSNNQFRFHSSVSIEQEQAQQQPELVKIPALPIVGSMYPQWYSGIPAMDISDINGYWRKLHKEYGPFYSVGIPGFGAGIMGTLHVVRDPSEMLRVLKQEGAFPSGQVEAEWPIVEYMKRKDYTAVGLFSRGEEWKRLRTFIQKDLLSPASAKEYLPAIISGAALASSKAGDKVSLEDINYYLNLSAIDMFSHVLFGSGPVALGDDYGTFCRDVANGLASTFDLLSHPREIFMHKVGIESEKTKKFYEMWGRADSIAERRLTDFVNDVKAKQANGEELPETVQNCYLLKLLERQPESNVTMKEAFELCQLVLAAAVDTTSAKTSWNLVQLAINPEQQELLYQELKQAVEQHGNDGSLTPEALDAVPLLSAFVRETHRCTPALGTDIMKEVSAPTLVHGVTLPAGSKVQFDSLTNMMDPELVEDPLEFRPQRWLKAAVAARKDTPAAIIDHPFYSGPFSQGARRCPGSRVALLEVRAMIAQLVLDWKIVGPEDKHWKEIPSTIKTLCVPVFEEVDIKFVPRRS